MADADVENLTLVQLREIRRHLQTLQSLTETVAAFTQRLDRRIDQLERRIGDVQGRVGDQRDDLELLLKIEVGGRLTHFETRVDERFARVEGLLERLLERDAAAAKG